MHISVDAPGGRPDASRATQPDACGPARGLAANRGRERRAEPIFIAPIGPMFIASVTERGSCPESPLGKGSRWCTIAL